MLEHATGYTLLGMGSGVFRILVPTHLPSFLVGSGRWVGTRNLNMPKMISKPYIWV